MRLKQIFLKEELLNISPQLYALHKELKGKWEQDLNQDEFLVKLFNYFPIATFYYELRGVNELNYFIATLNDEKPMGKIWLFYLNPKSNLNSVELVNSLCSELKDQGYKEVEFNTKRMTKSYGQWTKKFKFETKPSYLTYKTKLL